MSDDLEKVLSKYIERHGSLSKAVTSLVLGIDAMYRIERRVLRDMFEQPEINLMLNNALSSNYNPQHTAGAVLADTMDDGQANFDYFGVDKEGLLTKLQGLTVSQQYALADWLMEMSVSGSSVFTSYNNLKDFLNFNNISEAKVAEVCSTSHEVVRQWVAGDCVIPQEALKRLNLFINSKSHFM